MAIERLDDEREIGSVTLSCGFWNVKRNNRVAMSSALYQKQEIKRVLDRSHSRSSPLESSSCQHQDGKPKREGTER